MKKDMFYNYDHNIDNDEYPEMPYIDEPRRLESRGNLETVYDAFGNEIGLEAKKGSQFDLYFDVEGFDNNGNSVYDIVSNCMSINFELIKNWKQADWRETAMQKDFIPADVFDNGLIVIPVDLTDNDMTGVFKVVLTLIWAGGKYELFGEKDGFLMIR